MAEQFEFWISDTRLPVTPGELSISNGVNIEKVDLANGNKFTRFVGKELSTISFTASFPTVNRNRPHYAFYDISDPLYYWNKFRNLMVNGTPFELLIIQKPNVNRAIGGWYLINSMDEKYSADKGSEMEISFELIKYVAPTTVRVVQSPQKKEQTWIDTFGKNLADMNESAKKYLENLTSNLSEQALDGLMDYDVETISESERPRNLSEIPEFHFTESQFSHTDPDYRNSRKSGVTFTSLSFQYYKDVLHAPLIRSLNPKLAHFSFTEFLPRHTHIRLRMHLETDN